MNNASNIVCPKCGAEIALTEAVTGRFKRDPLGSKWGPF